jgi:ABC-type glycerol-3-phosphate transport system substrate-binding protein
MREIDRRRLLQVIGASGAIGLAGCSGNGDSTDSEDGESDGSDGSDGDGGSTDGGDGGSGSQETTEITYRDRSGGSDPSIYADVFNESQDGIQVNPSMKPVEEKYRALIAQISAGNAPDVLGLDVVYLPRFVQLGALDEINDFYESRDYTDEIFQPLREDFIQWDGDYYAMPFWIDLSAYYYNKLHYEEAGLDPENPPETFQEFLDACEALQQAGYDTPLSNTLGFVGLESFFYLPHVWAGGGEFLNEDQTECLIDEQPAVDALEFFLELQEKGYSTDQTSTESFTYGAFAAEETSMMYGGGTGVGAVKNQNEELFNNMGTAMFPKPEGGERSSFLGGDSISVSTQTSDAKREASMEFIDWVNSEEGMRVTVEDLGYLPARRSGFETEYVAERQDIFAAFEQAMEQGHAPPMHPNFLEMQGPLNNAIARVLLGEQDPQPALTQAANSINSVLQS